MKKYLLLIFFALSACTKDSSTSTQRECKDCLNGGWCEDGEPTCSCPLGYSGHYCEFRYLPSLSIIKSVQITNYPLVDGVYQWDSGSDADICLQIYQTGNNYTYTSDTLSNVPHNKPISFNPSYPVEFLQDTILVNLLDIDSVFVDSVYQGTTSEDIQYLDIKIPEITPHLTGKRPPEKFSYNINGTTIAVEMEHRY